MSLPPRRERQLSARSTVLQHVDGRVEADLIAAARAGHRESFDRIMERYEPVLYNVAVRVVRDREEALDVVQSTFLRAWDRLDTFDPSQRLFSWLYRIAINVALNARARHRDCEAIDELADDPRMSSPRPGPDDDLARLESNVAIERAMAQLPQHYREVVLLRHFSDLSYEEIAQALDIEVKTVRSRLFTARRRLAELLEGFAREASA